VATAFTSYDRVFQPIILVRVDGEDADDLVFHMESLDVHDELKKAMEATIVFEAQDPEPGLRGSLIEDERLQPGANWEIRWGYLTDLSRTRRFLVTHFIPDFRLDGSLKVTLFLHSKGARLNRDTKSRNWGRVNTSDIARRIASRYGLAADIEISNDRRNRAYVQPTGTPDLVYLQKLAAKINFVSYVDGEILVYRRPRTDETPLIELVWYGGGPTEIMQSFRPEIKAVPRRKSKVNGPDDKNNKKKSSQSRTGGNADSALGKIVTFDATHRSFWESEGTGGNSSTPETDSRKRKRDADAKQKKLLERANKATITCLGTPRLHYDLACVFSSIGIVAFVIRFNVFKHH